MNIEFLTVLLHFHMLDNLLGERCLEIATRADKFAPTMVSLFMFIYGVLGHHPLTPLAFNRNPVLHFEAFLIVLCYI